MWSLSTFVIILPTNYYMVLPVGIMDFDKRIPPVICLKMFSEVIKLTNTKYMNLTYLSLLRTPSEFLITRNSKQSVFESE